MIASLRPDGERVLVNPKRTDQPLSPPNLNQRLDFNFIRMLSEPYVQRLTRFNVLTHIFPVQISH
jgi:hypothetical protein